MNHNFRRAHSAPPSFGHQQPRQPTSPAQQLARNPSEPPNQFVPQVVLMHDPYSFNGPKPYTQKARTGQATRSSPSPTTNNDPRELPASLTKPSRQNSVQKFSARSPSMPIEKTDKYAKYLRHLEIPTPPSITSTNTSNTLQASDSSSTRQQSLGMSLSPPSTQPFPANSKSSPREKTTDTSYENAHTSETITSTQTHPEVSNTAQINPDKIPYISSKGETYETSRDIYKILLVHTQENENNLHQSLTEQGWSEKWINNDKKIKDEKLRKNEEKISNLCETYADIIMKIGGRKTFLDQTNKLLQTCYQTIDKKNSIPYPSGSILGITESLLDKLDKLCKTKTNFGPNEFEAYINFLINEVIKAQQNLHDHLHNDQKNISIPSALVLLIIESRPPNPFNLENFWPQLAQMISGKSFEQFSGCKANNRHLAAYKQMIHNIFYNKAQNKQLDPKLDGKRPGTDSSISIKNMERRITQYQKIHIEPLLRAAASCAPSAPNHLTTGTEPPLLPANPPTLANLKKFLAKNSFTTNLS